MYIYRPELSVSVLGWWGKDVGPICPPGLDGCLLTLQEVVTADRVASIDDMQDHLVHVFVKVSKVTADPPDPQEVAKGDTVFALQWVCRPGICASWWVYHTGQF